MYSYILRFLDIGLLQKSIMPDSFTAFHEIVTSKVSVVNIQVLALNILIKLVVFELSLGVICYTECFPCITQALQ